MNLNKLSDPAAITQKIMRLALPMAITQFIAMGGGFLCMTMLAKLGQIVLAASALIFSISLAVNFIGISLLFSISILIGYAHGRQDYLGVGTLWQQGWLAALIISLPILLVYRNIYPMLIFFGQNPEIALVVKIYFHAYSWTVIPFLLGVCNQQLCYGVHKQKIDMLANIVGTIVLLTSASILIFGKWGFAKLGVAGLVYALAFQSGFYFLFTTTCFYQMAYFKKFNLFQVRICQNWQILKDLLKTGWPISLQMSGEMLSFMVCGIFVGWLGIVSLAAYQIMMQYEFLSVIPIFAISQASSILIGQAIGGKQFTDIKKLGMGSLRVAVSLGLLVAVALLFSPAPLASLYLNVHDPANAKILHLVIQLFAIMALSQLLDAVRNVLIGSLRGLLDTRFAMLAGLLVIWLISVPLGYLFAFPLHGGAVGAMLGWIVGMAISIVILWYRWQLVSIQVYRH